MRRVRRHSDATSRALPPVSRVTSSAGRGGVHRGAELPEPRGRARLDRADRDREPSGDLRGRQAAVLGELEHLALFHRKRLNRGADARALRAADGVVLRRRGVLRDRLGAALGSSALLAADSVERAASQTHKEPGPDRPSRVGYGPRVLAQALPT